jgi:hypothetical protein
MKYCVQNSYDFNISHEQWQMIQNKKYQVRFAWYKVNDTRRSYSIDQYETAGCLVNGTRPKTTRAKSVVDRVFGDDFSSACHEGKNTLSLTDVVCRCGDSIALYLVKVMTIEEIIAHKEARSVIPYEQALEKVKQQFLADDEIEMTSFNVSVRDAVSYCRMEVPSRGMSCAHVQCFDLSSYLELNKITLHFKCPVCNERVTHDKLIIDPYFKQILADPKVTSNPDLDEVNVNQDGTFTVPSKRLREMNVTGQKRNRSEDSEDDDGNNREVKKIKLEADFEEILQFLNEKPSRKQEEDQCIIVLSDDEEEEDL